MQAPNRRRAGVIALAILGAVFVIWIGYRYWYQPTFVFVEATDAEVAGNVARIGAPTTGRVDKMLVDFGDQVSAGQQIASIVARLRLTGVVAGDQPRGGAGDGALGHRRRYGDDWRADGGSR